MNEHRDASNRLTFDFDRIESRSYSKITKAVVSHFKLVPDNKLTEGLDEIFQDYKSGDSVVGLEWDNWSGYIVNAKNTKSEQLVKEIAAFINENYEKST
ncbi:MAG: hypothetical protein OEY06_11595 [Gammaproteobacteria bacterium]|nr:hypothetical protein [Gammaproteobacteria bacterium]